MEKEYLLSIAIPTYNRYKYLRECLKTVSDIKSDQIEIVVSDNTVDNKEIVSYINSLNDDRIKYFHNLEYVGETANLEYASRHSTGKYICVIGDDDTICEHIVSAVEFMYQNDIEACCFNIPGYNWPDVTFEGRKKESNYFLNRKPDEKVTIIDAKEELNKCLSIGGMLLVFSMPRLYHGIVSRDCLERIREKAGVYYPGPSPDMANATAVCLESKKTAIFNDCLIVSGYGHASCKEGGETTHYGKLDEKPWLPKDVLEKWDEDLPKIFSSETIFAQSCLQALKEMGAEDYIKKFNFSRCYARFLYKHKKALGQMLLFCLKKPYRFVQIIKGAFMGGGVKINPNYLEENEIYDLKSAQNYTHNLCKDIKSYCIVN